MRIVTYRVTLSCGCVVEDDETPDPADEGECEIHDTTAIPAGWETTPGTNPQT